jgi:hypothetical protein
MSLAGDLPAAELQLIYDRVIELICKAMSDTQLPDWPVILFAAEHRDDATPAAVRAKRLAPETRDRRSNRRWRARLQSLDARCSGQLS